MHNWLIFQHHRVRAQSNIGTPKGLAFGPNRPIPWRIAKRGRRRVGEPRRWLSWGKRVGRGLGKSGPR